MEMERWIYDSLVTIEGEANAEAGRSRWFASKVRVANLVRHVAEEIYKCFSKRWWAWTAEDEMLQYHSSRDGFSTVTDVIRRLAKEACGCIAGKYIMLMTELRARIGG